MASSIFSITDWATSTLYRVHDPILYNDLYYYALTEHTSGGSFDTDLDNGKWGGITTDENGETKPIFLWTPSYRSNTNNEPRVNQIQFGDGYSQRLEDGINNVLLNLELNFDNRDLNEATAILHFLYVRKGVESFLFTARPPFGKQKRFICKQWSDTSNFYNDISIRARFEETAA